MNTKALRQKILDLAIHGKLLPLEKVEQIRKDEPASILLEKIRADRTVTKVCGSAQNGKSKRDKNDSFIFVGDDKRHYEKVFANGKTANGTVKDIEDEIPFEVPEGWSWCRLGEVCEYGKCINVNSSSLKADDWILDLEDIEKETGRIIAFHSFKDRKSESTKHKFYKNQVLYSKLRPYLNKVVIAPKDGFCTSEILPLDFNSILISRYAQVVLMSSYFLSTVNMITYGVKMPRLGTEAAKKLFLPLPPLSEQQLIVEEIEKIFAQIDLLEQNKTDLQTAIKQAKSKILDLAIHGKLVPQDPNDESASVLLEKIRAEKEAKIAKGELKRNKNDSYIYKSSTDNCHYEKLNGKDVCIEDEIPFTIPDSWQWCRLGEITSEILYGVNESAKEKGDYRLLRITDIQNDSVNWYSVPFTNYPKEKVNNYLLQNNDIVFARTGATVGKSFLIENLVEPAIYASYLIRIRILFSPKYIKTFFGSPCYWNQITDKSSGIGQPNVNGTSLANLFIPLPPLSEQKRIVVKIEELFSLLDQIQTNIV